MNNDAIIKKLLEHDERFDILEEKMVTRSDVNQIMTLMDKQIVILQRLDQERIFTQEWVRRIESDVEKSKKDIEHMKKLLKVA
jgi:hypothetical protein